MMLKTITCSGANEYTDQKELIAIIKKFPKAELGIQVSDKKGGFGTARYWWLQALYYQLYNKPLQIKIALHVNGNWVERFGQGDVPTELKEFLTWRNFVGEPFIGRVQLNFKIGREKTPDMKKMVEAMLACQNLSKEEIHRFILSYNAENADFIHQMYDYTRSNGLKFDLLFDNSHGEGILAESYPAPVYKKVVQGYSGGLSPENITEQLWEISKAVPVGCEFCIDAEGRLKGEDGHFSLSKCEEYLKKASCWDAI